MTPVPGAPSRLEVMFHVKLEDVRSHPAARGLDADQVELLVRYEALLRERAVPLGLVAPGDVGSLMERHVLDSLRAVPCIPPSAADLADLGSGAGLPGLPLAIAIPRLSVCLVERSQRRAAFLEVAVERLGLADRVRVLVATTEEVTETFDVCVARALAGADEVWRLAFPLLRGDGRVVYFAGRGWRDLPREHAGGAGTAPYRVEICDPSRFHHEGPVVIMQRIRLDHSGEP